MTETLVADGDWDSVDNEAYLRQLDRRIGGHPDLSPAVFGADIGRRVLIQVSPKGSVASYMGHTTMRHFVPPISSGPN